MRRQNDFDIVIDFVQSGQRISLSMLQESVPRTTIEIVLAWQVITISEFFGISRLAENGLPTSELSSLNVTVVRLLHTIEGDPSVAPSNVMVRLDFFDM
jgi:hypothetical protein